MRDTASTTRKRKHDTVVLIVDDCAVSWHRLDMGTTKHDVILHLLQDANLLPGDTPNITDVPTDSDLQSHRARLVRGSVPSDVIYEWEMLLPDDPEPYMINARVPSMLSLILRDTILRMSGTFVR